MFNGHLGLSDRTLEYRVIGDARPGSVDIVMLHEGLGSAALWKDFPIRLARESGCRTVLYSRHGYGRSSRLTAERTPDFMHDEAHVWLPQVLDRLGIRKPLLFGHSDGASIALIHAAGAAATVAGVVALAPHVRVEGLTLASIRAARESFQNTDLRTRLARYHADVDGAFWGWNRVWLDPSFADWNIESLLPMIRVPLLAIQGADDEYGTMAQVESIQRHVPGATVIALEGCGHSPHVSRPDAVIAATRTLLERIATIAPTDGGQFDCNPLRSP